MDPITQAIFYQKFNEGKLTAPMMLQLLHTIDKQQQRISQLERDLSSTLAINVELTQIQKRNEAAVNRLKSYAGGTVLNPGITAQAATI